MPKTRAKTKQMQALERLDLTENESFLYSFLLNHPNSTVQQLQAKTPFPRTMLYYVLNRLIEMNLVSTTKNSWRTVYRAESPDRLYDLLSKKEQEFEQTNRTIRRLIPRLKNQHRLAGRRLSVRTFEGLDEYKRALEDVLLTHPDCIFSYESFHPNGRSGVEIRDAHNRTRIAKKIQKRVLTKSSEVAMDAIKARPYDDHTQIRLNPIDHEALDVDLLLYDGKVMYTSYEDREPVGMIVEDQALYEMKKVLFESLWQQAKDVTLLPYEK